MAPDEAPGRAAGVLLARAGTSDVIAAAVILPAGDGDEILTSDPGGLAVLAAAGGVDVDLVAVSSRRCAYPPETFQRREDERMTEQAVPATQTGVQVQELPTDVDAPLVGIIMGSKSDMDVMDGAASVLRDADVSHEVRVMSAHREPELVAEYCKSARMRGMRVLVAGAGLSAALPGVAAAHSDLPVIGVPLSSRLSAMGGMDAILSVVQMPPGVPVAAVGLDNAKNAGHLALRILRA